MGWFEWQLTHELRFENFFFQKMDKKVPKKMATIFGEEIVYI